MKVKTDIMSNGMAFAHIDRKERGMLKNQLLDGKGYVWIHSVTFHYQILDDKNPTAVRGSVEYPLKQTIKIEKK